MKRFFVVMMLFSAVSAWAETYVAEDEDYRLEVTIDKNDKEAEVAVVKAKKDLPKTLDLVLYRGKNKPHIVSLKAVDLPTKENGPLKRYQGSVDFGNASYAGVALQWNFDLGTKKLKAKKQ